MTQKVAHWHTLPTSGELLAQRTIALANDELARRSVARFAATLRGIVLPPHQIAIASSLDNIMSRTVRFQYIAMPPRHGKSEFSSIIFPAFVLGQQPHAQIIHISHSAALSNEFSRQVRDIIRTSPTYRRLFPNTKLHPDKQNVAHWKTTAGGGLLSVGIGGGITGHGADYIIIDDPLKEGDADSPQTLEQIYTWYATAARTRLHPGGAVLIAMTRWHPRDLAGRVLDLMSNPAADQWASLVLPALAQADDALGRQPGAALWPDRYSSADLLAVQHLSERLFASLYQQQPRADSDYLFDISRIAAAPPTDFQAGPRAAWCFDLALSDKESADYTTMCRAQYDPHLHHLHITHAYRFRREWPDTQFLAKMAMSLYPEDDFVFPEHLLELVAVQQLRRDMPSARVRTIRLVGDKRARAQVLADANARAGLSIADGIHRPDYLSELRNFTGISDDHDDCTDCLSLAAAWFSLPRGLSIASVSSKPRAR